MNQPHYSGSLGKLRQLPIATRFPLNIRPVSFRFQHGPNSLTLSWPADHTGWHLQIQTNSPNAGLSANWTTVPGSDQTNQFTLTIDPANGSVFLRLVYP